MMLKKCQLCPLTFRRTSELNRHHTRAHGLGVVNKFQCQWCQYATFSRQHLDRHHQAMHSDNVEAIPERFHCRLCSFSSASLDNLRKHILKTQKHPGARVYNCTFCSEFDSDSRLEFRNHLQTAHPAKEVDSVLYHYFSPNE